MNELTSIRKKIADLFDQGNVDALDRIYVVLNKTTAEIAIMRALLSPTREPEPQEPLEMEETAPSTPTMDFTEK